MGKIPAVICAFAVAVACFSSLQAKDNRKRVHLAQDGDANIGTLMNINDISLWIYPSGKSGIDPNGNAGGIFPRGTAGIIFQDGILWGAKVFDGQDPTIRAGGQKYQVGTVPGRILSPGVKEDPLDLTVDHIWRIRHDYFTADLTRDAAEQFQKTTEEVTEADVEAVRSRYRQDWLAWPADKGAPFYDADGDGVYTPQFNANGAPKRYPQADEPGLFEADQVAWLVANDLDPGAVQTFLGSPSIGLEMQMTLWAYRDIQPVSSVIFKHVRLIYKGAPWTSADAHIDSMYLAQWSDPDLGLFTNDLMGCDTLANIGFAYNSIETDVFFQPFHLPPPAAGYVLLAGPVAPQSGGTAVFDFRSRQGFRNLKMSAFGFQKIRVPDGVPPPFTDYDRTLMFWNVLRGFKEWPIHSPQRWSDPSGKQFRYLYPGDPIPGSGWLDPQSGDKHFIMASGPFSMAPGDTNEINTALVGGIGSDRLSSLSAVTYYAGVAQSTFDERFPVPYKPETPALQASVFEDKIILNWGAGQADVERVERRVRDYDFEGYNVYQLPDTQSPLRAGVKLATFDRIDGVLRIVGKTFDPQTGLLLPVLLQKGSDSGLMRSMVIEKDSLNQRPFLPGQTYVFAVTAFNYNPDAPFGAPSVESAPGIATITFHSTDPGQQFSASLQDTIVAARIRGDSDGEVLAIVVDPTRVTGDLYKVTFEQTIGGVVTWNLIDDTAGDTLLKKQTNQSGDSDYLVTDGLLVKVITEEAGIATKVPEGADGLVEVANAGHPLTPDEYDERGRPFAGNRVWHSLNSNQATERYFVSAIGFLADMTRHLANAVPNDLELRFTEGGSWGWWKFDRAGTARVPFELWQVGAGTYDDPSDDVQLIPILKANDTPGIWDVNAPEPHFNFPASDAIFWFYDSRGYDAYAADAMDGALADTTFGEKAYLSGMLLADFDNNGQIADAGTVIRVVTNKPNAPGVEFNFSTRDFAPAFSLQDAKQDVQKINVFPNPYYGLFRFESPFPEQKYVTFSHLPQKAVVRIFSLSGTMVRKLEKDDPGQFLHWDLLNESGRAVAGGLYIAHVQMPELGLTKVLKLAVFHE